MTTKVKRGGVFENIGGPVRPAPAPWVRPPDWLALPAVNIGDKKFVGLHAVYPGDSNFVALSAAGAYTVDWGDGTAIENIATGVQANHNFLFASVAAGTLTSGGYRQAVVTVTMQGAASFTSLNLLLKHPTTVLGTYATGWLDIRLAGASLNTLALGGTSPVAQRRLQQFEYVGPSTLASCASLFSGCGALGSVVGTAYTAAATNMNSMFSGCSSLAVVPLFNTAAVTSMSTMFQSCSSLQVGAMSGTKVSVDYTGCKLSAGELDSIYTNLAAGVTGQTITVTGNWGVATDNPAIATAKGWAVTG